MKVGRGGSGQGRTLLIAADISTLARKKPYISYGNSLIEESVATPIGKKRNLATIYFVVGACRLALRWKKQRIDK